MMRRALTSGLAGLALGCLVACQDVPREREMDENTAVVNAEVVAGVETWRQERKAGLMKPDGWLTLVGLDWLEEGANAVGSGEGKAVTLPASTPEDLGTLQLADGVVSLELADGVDGLTVAGEPFSGGVLAPDTSGEATLVEMGGVNFHIIEREGRYGVRTKDAAAKTYTEFKGLSYYDASIRWRVIATVLPYDPPKTLPVPNVLGYNVDSEVPAAVEFYLDGTIHRLDALPGTDGGFHLVFGDRTNGVTTYGGGRFIYTDAPNEQGKVVVDFNRAYNPPCVFTPYATCPLAPPQNKLAVAVEAGEKSYAGGKH